MKPDGNTLRMRDRIVESCDADREELPGAMLARLAGDPLRPVSRKGRFRMNPVLVLLIALGALTALAFLFFSSGVV
jgi:hypothetical protein